MIVTEDADLDKAVMGAITGSNHFLFSFVASTNE